MSVNKEQLEGRGKKIIEVAQGQFPVYLTPSKHRLTYIHISPYLGPRFADRKILTRTLHPSPRAVVAGDFNMLSGATSLYKQ